MPRSGPSIDTVAAPARFVTTHWSVVLAAGQSSSAKASDALTQLCRTYWYPLYAYVRRKGYKPEEAQDLTQELFTRLLAGNYFSSVDPRKGKFRSFLLASLEHFLAKEWTRAQRLKRGGGAKLLSLDDDAEDRYKLEPSHEATPAKIFERRWALTLLERALGRLQAEQQAANKAGAFEHLKIFLSGERPDCSYAQVAESLGTSEASVKVAIHRLRRRYRELVRDEVAQTVTSPEEVDEEIQYLFQALR